MRYYKLIENNVIVAIGTGFDGMEITEVEYNELLAMICKKANFTDKLYNNEITLDDIPTEWQEEIQRRVDERIAFEASLPEEQPIKD